MVFLPSQIVSEITSLAYFLKIIYFCLAVFVSNEMSDCKGLKAILKKRNEFYI